MRHSGRQAHALRKVTLEPGISRYAEGSCLASFGHTKVLCTATVENSVPPWLRNTGKGWVTAEYGMLPRSTHTRMSRDGRRGQVSGRTQEIQRLIGRSLRAVTNLSALGERQIMVDCDVIEADGGTRTASITGAYVALMLACNGLVREKSVAKHPVIEPVAAISAGIYKGTPILDLEYEEDSAAEVDANFVMTGSGAIVEVQATGEETTFSEEQLQSMLTLAKKGVAELIELQKKALGL